MHYLYQLFFLWLLIVQLLPIPREEAITSLLSVSSFDDENYLLMLTRGGYIKRTPLSAFSKIRANGLIAIGLEDGDALTWVRLAESGDSVLIGSKNGMTIHFRLNDSELRPLGRSARGVKSMNLKSGDSLVSISKKLMPFKVIFGVGLLVLSVLRFIYIHPLG